MKKLLIAGMIVLTQVGGAWAQSVPKKFQGTWVRVDNPDDKSPTKIGAGTIDFGPGFKSTISKVEPGDEDGTTLIVTYKPGPEASPVTWVLRLMKLNGRETLIWVCGCCYHSRTAPAGPRTLMEGHRLGADCNVDWSGFDVTGRPRGPIFMPEQTTPGSAILGPRHPTMAQR